MTARELWEKYPDIRPMRITRLACLRGELPGYEKMVMTLLRVEEWTHKEYSGKRFAVEVSGIDDERALQKSKIFDSLNGPGVKDYSHDEYNDWVLFDLFKNVFGEHNGRENPRSLGQSNGLQARPKRSEVRNQKAGKGAKQAPDQDKKSKDHSFQRLEGSSKRDHQEATWVD